VLFRSSWWKSHAGGNQALNIAGDPSRNRSASG